MQLYRIRVFISFLFSFWMVVYFSIKSSSECIFMAGKKYLWLVNFLKSPTIGRCSKKKKKLILYPSYGYSGTEDFALVLFRYSRVLFAGRYCFCNARIKHQALLRMEVRLSGEQLWNLFTSSAGCPSLLHCTRQYDIKALAVPFSHVVKTHTHIHKGMQPECPIYFNKGHTGISQYKQPQRSQ